MSLTRRASLAPSSLAPTEAAHVSRNADALVVQPPELSHISAAETSPAMKQGSEALVPLGLRLCDVSLAESSQIVGERLAHTCGLPASCSYGNGVPVTPRTVVCGRHGVARPSNETEAALAWS